ncbi:MAG: type II toxin-antitoxin system VapC family toxin [Xanthobacteraceae bacterium]
MSLVLDASVTASWHLRDEGHENSNRILERLHVEGAFVPMHWWFEIRNVLMRSEQRGRASRQQTDSFLETLRGLPVSAMPLPDEIPVIVLARQHRLSFYDAAYLELAQRESLTLATFDRDLIAAAKAERVPLA